MILAGDFGGTNARLALFEAGKATLRIAWRQTYAAREADWREFLTRARRAAGNPRLTAAAVAVAGPVSDGKAHLTNLGWHVTAVELAQELGLQRAWILNDLEASAHGLLVLEGADLITLREGESDPPGKGAPGNKVLCSPGTGLGTAALVWDGEHYHAVASEGGHATFSPLDETDRNLAEFLARRHGHVSWERVLSGPGLLALHEFERERRRTPDPPELAHALRSGEGAAAITRHALSGTCPEAERTLERFAHNMGVAASNLALQFLARGGVYLGGGIPPKIRTFLERPAFGEAFLAKGRLRETLASMSVHVVMNPDCALLGAAHRANALALAAHGR